MECCIFNTFFKISFDTLFFISQLYNLLSKNIEIKTLSSEIFIYIYIYIYISIYLYLYIYTCIYIYVINISNIRIEYRNIEYINDK